MPTRMLVRCVGGRLIVCLWSRDASNRWFTGFADRGIRIVTLALGGGLGDDLGCIAITHPMSRFLHPMTQLRQGPETDPHALLQYVCLFR